MASPVIQAQGVKKSYRSGTVVTSVLHGIDLQIWQGECVFLVGPSGSGKTTLLSILGCVLTPDEGRVRILGEDVIGLRARKLVRFRREQIGFVFQRFHLFNGLRAWENVRVAFDLLGIAADKGKRQSLELLEMVGLADRAYHQISQLSMGQRQRVALARALAGDPQLILADEPTAALDAESGQSAMSILKDLCNRLHKTVIVVTHDNRIFHMADRILTLIDGRIDREAVSHTSDIARKNHMPAIVSPGAA